MCIRISILAMAVIAPWPISSALAQVTETEESEAISFDGQSSSEGSTVDLPPVVQSIIEHTNQFRQDEGLSSVEIDPKLTETAQYFADYMARTDTYGHGADGQRPADRAQEHGYEYCIVSENIAYQYRPDGVTAPQLAEAFFNGWKDSPGHRENMLAPHVTQSGVAVAHSDKTNYYYAVQMFGRPRSAAIEFVVTNRADENIEYESSGRKFSLPPGMIRTHRQCRPAEMTFRLPDADGEVKTVRPSHGDRFIVEDGRGGLDLKRTAQ
jgi:uncharacterized protein YkwD